MWMFRGRQHNNHNHDDASDDDYESDDDYDSDEYDETNGNSQGQDDDELLDSDDDDDDQDSLKNGNRCVLHDDKEKQNDTKEDTEDNSCLEKMVDQCQHDPIAAATATVEKQRKEIITNDEIEQQDTVNEDYLLAGTDEQHVKEKESEEEESEEEEESVEEEEEGTSSLEEKRSLLALAVEHDRVDIIKALLERSSSNNTTTEDRDILLQSPNDNENNHSPPPPLHIAISFGSTNAATSLLRMGANPSIRPTKGKFANLSAWEMAFGYNDDNDESSISSSPMRIMIDLPPSKREGIRHAFTAEALRCIGSDEVDRLQHLLSSGMPSSIDIGGKTLHGWCVEMDATKCEELTRPTTTTTTTTTTTSDSTEIETESTPTKDVEESYDGEETTRAAIISNNNNNPDSMTSRLDNRLEELDSLAKALSICLDNLAEEVSVCHGLLLLGGGASALASHVKSLKVVKERREHEVEQAYEEWENVQDELAYWLQQQATTGGTTTTTTTTDLMMMIPNSSSSDLLMVGIQPTTMEQQQQQQHSLEGKSSFTKPPLTPEEEEAQQKQLKAQIAASEYKVRKLRASIADLSEENARDLVEVERRGLSGGVKLVRTLREELRQVEFDLAELNSATAACRAAVSLIETRVEAEHKKRQKGDHYATNNDQEGEESQSGEALLLDESQAFESISIDRTSTTRAGPSAGASDRIASGDSEAITVRQPDGRGYFSVDLWEIILRIIGLGRVAVKKSPEDLRDKRPSAMII